MRRDIYKIYGLICPFENRIVYVGCSCQEVRVRVNGHIHSGRHSNKRYREWIVGMKEIGVRPGYVILEYDCVDWKARERYWIWLFGLDNLYNQASGGVHGFEITMRNWYSRMEVTGIPEYEHGPEEELRILRKRNIKAFDRFMNDSGMVKRGVPLGEREKLAPRRDDI